MSRDEYVTCYADGSFDYDPQIERASDDHPDAYDLADRYLGKPWTGGVAAPGRPCTFADLGIGVPAQLELGGAA